MGEASGHRVKNKHSKALCAACLNDGFVVYDEGNEPQTEADYAALRQLRRDIRVKVPSYEPIVYGEALAPCPKCEIGHGIEFPADTTGPWGKDGFWQGREQKDVRPARSPIEAPLPAHENAGRMRELMVRFESKQSEYFEEREARMRAARLQRLGADTVVEEPETVVDETYFEPSKPLF